MELLGKLQLTCVEPRFCKDNCPRRFLETVFLTFIKNKLTLTPFHNLDFSQSYIQKSNHNDIKTEWHIPKIPDI